MGRNEGNARNRWFTLGEASRTLGVTPNTLRRWADRGQISTFTTPGGHRRFLIAAVEALVPAGRARRPSLATSPDRVARAYRRARPLAGTQGHAGWLTNLSEAERTRFRELGRQLVGDLLAHLDGRQDSLTMGERHASEYGAEAARLGASLSDTVDGFLRFRKPFVDELVVLARKRRLDTREATALLVDAESALDRLLAALMTAHTKR